ncbi:hypothetical protein D3C78_1553730 [compost metagenome]
MYAFAPDTIQAITDGIKLEKKVVTNAVTSTEDKEITITADGKLMITDNGVDQEIDIRSNINTGSSITLKCNRPDIVTTCKTGVIEIEFDISQDRNGHSQQLVLDSKFGF